MTACVLKNKHEVYEVSGTRSLLKAGEMMSPNMQKDQSQICLLYKHHNSSHQLLGGTLRDTPDCRIAESSETTSVFKYLSHHRHHPSTAGWSGHLRGALPPLSFSFLQIQVSNFYALLIDKTHRASTNILHENQRRRQANFECAALGTRSNHPERVRGFQGGCHWLLNAGKAVVSKSCKTRDCPIASTAPLVAPRCPLTCLFIKPARFFEDKYNLVHQAAEVPNGELGNPHQW